MIQTRVLDPIIIVKILLLKQWYSLSDPQVEREIRDRISFMKLLGSKYNPVFLGEIAKAGKDPLVFYEIRNSIMVKRICIKRGTMQEASFIEEAKGECGKPRCEDAKTLRSRNGASATKIH